MFDDDILRAFFNNNDKLTFSELQKILHEIDKTTNEFAFFVGVDNQPRVDLKTSIEEIVTPDEVKYIMELSGVEKNGLKIQMTDDFIDVIINRAQKAETQRVLIKHKLDPKTGRATFFNGVLEITLKKIKSTFYQIPVKY